MWRDLGYKWGNLRMGTKRPKSVYRDARFWGLWLLFFTLCLALASALRFLPRAAAEFGLTIVAPLTGDNAVSPLVVTAPLPRPRPGTVTAPVRPRIIVPDLGINASIELPTSTALEVLNDHLTRGVVHYPGSALPGEFGNVFLFGHSTGLRVVHNQAYAVFNGLKELTPGQVVRIRYGGREYWYRVTSVAMKAADEAWVDLRRDTKQRKLTLSTCNVFGAKTDRFVVEAEFVKSYPLRSYASASGTSS